MQVVKPILLRSDAKLLEEALRINRHHLLADVYDAFMEKLQQAKVVEAEQFPREVIRLNTKAVIQDKQAGLKYSYTVVLPQHADHRRCRVSVFSPIGRALFGFRKGEVTYWQYPFGKRISPL